MSTNDRDPAAGIAAQCAGNRYDNKQWRQVNGRIYAGRHFVDPAHLSSRNEALLCLPDSEEGRGRSRKRNATAPFAQRIRELLFAISEIGHTFVVHGFGPVVIFVGEDIDPAQTTVGEFFEDPFVLVANRPRKIILGGEQIALGYRIKEIHIRNIVQIFIIDDFDAFDIVERFDRTIPISAENFLSEITGIFCSRS